MHLLAAVLLPELPSIAYSPRRRNRRHTIVRARRLLNEPRLELSQVLHVLDSLGHTPHLVCIHHEHIALVIPDNLPRNAQPLLVHRNIASHLQLEMPVPLFQRLAQQTSHLVLSIAEPSRRRGIRRHSLRIEGFLDAACLAFFSLGEDFEGLLWSECVGDVAEVDEGDNLRGGHVGDDAPDRFVERLRPEVPDGVYDGAEGKVDDALLGADPTELRVVDLRKTGLAIASFEREYAR